MTRLLRREFYFYFLCPFFFLFSHFIFYFQLSTLLNYDLRDTPAVKLLMQILGFLSYYGSIVHYYYI